MTDETLRGLMRKPNDPGADLLQKIGVSLIQARAARLVGFLVVSGEADADPAAFVGQVKVVLHEMAEQGG